MVNMRKRIEVKDWEKFNYMTIVKEIDANNKWRRFLYKCICWNIREVNLYHLKSGQKSCWCIKKWKHWMTWTRFYNIYKNIVSRCTNQNCFSYTDYWERGIKNLWDNFVEFKNDMHSSYLDHQKKHWTKDTTIDRIDNNW